MLYEVVYQIKSTLVIITKVICLDELWDIKANSNLIILRVTKI
jgi:hypothetical protein